MRRIWKCALVSTLATSTAIAAASAADVTQQRLENAKNEPQNWLTSLGDYSAQRFSSLNQINRDNVKNLKVAFTVPLSSTLKGLPPTSGPLENPPLVNDGIMYVNDVWGAIYRIDVSDGVWPKITWMTDPAIDKAGGYGLWATRGMALWDNQAFVNLIDGRVVAMNATTGEITWDVKLGGQNVRELPETAAEAFTAAPLTADGKVLVGQSKGDWGTRGWLAALDVKDGKQLWRTYTVPAKGEPGNETWKDDHNAWRTGGAALWTTGSYDPVLKATYWGTANAVPMFDPEFRPGDNLFTNSVIGFDVGTGKMNWYFQYTANESWDYDENGVHFLYDRTVGGETRKVVGHFARNGYYYQFDRTNGQFLLAGQYVNQVNWTKGIDPKTGKPLEYNPALAVQTYLPETRNTRANPKVNVCPTMLGGLRWQPPSFNATKQVAYAAGIEGCSDIEVKPEQPLGPQGGNPKGPGQTFLAGVYSSKASGSIVAVDVNTGKTVAKAQLPYENLSGVLATAGGLVFTGNLDGSVAAYNDDNLTELWKFHTGINFKAPPIAYAVGGKQYIAIIAGGGPAPGQTKPKELSTMGQGAMLYVFTL
jgi:alcohol dehydrogenase (cytochrome c)